MRCITYNRAVVQLLRFFICPHSKSSIFVPDFLFAVILLRRSMGVTSSSTLSAAQEVKIYRQLKAEHAHLRIANPSISDEQLYQALREKHSQLVEAYFQDTGATGNSLCPKVRFGRTELQMPILTCGGMRMQQTWAPAEGTALEDINKECQDNFERIVDHCMKVSDDTGRARVYNLA